MDGFDAAIFRRPRTTHSTGALIAWVSFDNLDAIPDSSALRSIRALDFVTMIARKRDNVRLRI